MTEGKERKERGSSDGGRTDTRSEGGLEAQEGEMEGGGGDECRRKGEEWEKEKMGEVTR